MSRRRRAHSARPVLPAQPVPPRPVRHLNHAVALALVLFAGAAVYWPALKMFFAQDDVMYLSRASGLMPTPWSMARPLADGVAWRAQYAMFGLDPAPYAITRLVLHLACAALVYAAGLRLLRRRAAAAAAALLFAASPVAFTPLHWGACISELLAAALALGAFVLFLEALVQDRRGLRWISAAVAVAAVLAKETAIVLPLAFAVTLAGERPWRRGLRMLAPMGLVFALLAAAFIATRHLFNYTQYTGGDAYAMDFSPGHLIVNLCTYLRWCVPVGEAVRDRVAAADPSALPAGMALLIAIALTLLLSRGDQQRTAGVGAGWFAAFLLPVLPLAHHTYLYYLYLPWAGGCWLVVAGVEHMTARWPRPLAAAVAVTLLAGFAAGGWASVRDREAAMFGPIPADRTVREGLLMRNAMAGLRAAHLARGASVGFLNPWPTEHGQASRGGTPGSASAFSYIPLEGAMRGGEFLRLFIPGTTHMGFAEVPPPAWDRTDLFVFDNDGTLTHLGQGAPALTAYAGMLREAGRGAEAEALLERAHELAAKAPPASDRVPGAR
jgi:hypothetical protein